MADVLMSYMEIIGLASDENFASSQRRWAMEIRKLNDQKAKIDAVSNYLKKFQSDKQQNIMDATMLILKGNGTPGAGKWMQAFQNDVHVSIYNLVDELEAQEAAEKAVKEKEAAERAAAEKRAREAQEAAERLREAKERADRLREAAKQGDADAQFNLGRSYFTGQGETRDYAKAIEWFGKAAAQGHVEAKDWLANAEAVVEKEAKEKAEREAREAAEKAAKAKEAAKKKILATIGLALQIGVAVIAFFLASEAGRKDSVFLVALSIGIPALAIGIISLLFRKWTGSVAGMCLIFLIDIFTSTYMAKGEGIGMGILMLIVLFIPAIPGFIMTVIVMKSAVKTSEWNQKIILASGIIAVLFIIFLPQVGASQPDVPLNIGTWKLSGSTYSTNMYIRTYQGNTFTGSFDYWRKGKGNNRWMGTEYFEGTYDEQTQQVFIKGTRLSSDAKGLILGEYQAKVSDDGRKLINGTWGSGTTGEAKWVRLK